MPLKPSRKSKKLSQIEDNNELRLSLMQRSIPLPLVPLTDMSPPPPPPFEIRDLPSRSFAPAVDTATASTASSTTASNVSTGTSVARSIRCKDLDLNVSGTSASKKRRGPVIDAKTQQRVKVDGKIVVEYFDEHRGPANALPLASQVSVIEREIGAMRRTTVSGLRRSGRKSPKERGGARASASESMLAENIKSQEEQFQEMNERICQLEVQYADIHEIVRQLKETCEAAIGSNTSQR